MMRSLKLSIISGCGMPRSGAAVLRAALFLFLLLVGVSGCGYTVASLDKSDAVKGKMPEGIDTLAILFFDNLTARPGVDSVITLDLIDEFSSTVKIVEREEADAVLVGEVKTYSVRPISFTAGDVVREKRLKVTLAVMMIRRSDGEVLWSNDNISYYIDFISSTEPDSVVESADMEDDALKAVSLELTRRIKERILEGE